VCTGPDFVAITDVWANVCHVELKTILADEESVNSYHYKCIKFRVTSNTSDDD
jgi:hypothetical protein